MTPQREWDLMENPRLTAMDEEQDENEGFPHRSRTNFEYEPFPNCTLRLTGGFFSVSFYDPAGGTVVSKAIPQEILWQAKDFFDALERL